MKKFLVVCLVLLFAAPAMAADWNLYGSARVAFFYNTIDEDASGITDDGTPSGDPESDTDLFQDLQGNARIGAKVKTSDVVSGRFEYGHGPNPKLRLLYGKAKFGGTAFTVGQDYTPIDSNYSGRVVDDDIGLTKEGHLYESRKPQLKLKVGGFQAAFVQNKNTGDADTADNDDVLIPKIELAYDMKMSAFSIGAVFGFQTYDEGPSDSKEAVTSYVFGVRSRIFAGPAYINIVAYYAQNADNYGISLRNKFAAAQSHSGSDVEDATTYGGGLVVGAKLTNALKIEAGVGYIKNEVTAAASGNETSGDAMSYYINLPITLAKGVYIVPEITVFDLGENDDGTTTTENGQRTAFGAKFQINF